MSAAESDEGLAELERPVPFVVGLAAPFVATLAGLLWVSGFSAADVSISAAVAVALRGAFTWVAAKMLSSTRAPKSHAFSVLLRVPSSLGLTAVAAALGLLAVPYLAMGAIMAPARAVQAAYTLSAWVSCAVTILYAARLAIASSWLKADERGVRWWSLFRGRRQVRAASGSGSELILVTDSGTERLRMTGPDAPEHALAIARELSSRLPERRIDDMTRLDADEGHVAGAGGEAASDREAAAEGEETAHKARKYRPHGGRRS